MWNTCFCLVNFYAYGLELPCRWIDHFLFSTKGQNIWNFWSSESNQRQIIIANIFLWRFLLANVNEQSFDFLAPNTYELIFRWTSLATVNSSGLIQWHMANSEVDSSSSVLMLQMAIFELIKHNDWNTHLFIFADPIKNKIKVIKECEEYLERRRRLVKAVIWSALSK